MAAENSEKVRHIFGGIPPDKFRGDAAPSENLESLREDFSKLGISIAPDCEIANSSLRNLVEMVNSALVSYVREGKDYSPPPENRTVEDALFSAAERNFRIEIGANVKIGENVQIGTSVSIGGGTKVGNNAKINTGTFIGRNCLVSNGVFFSEDCVIGDDVIIEESVVFKPGTRVPVNSKVVHTSSENNVAKIVEKGKDKNE